ncbi:MAG: hypothetical protein EXR91_09700 [Gemmatimonadetes bacterium]|nr:hypothetical protein [Gemmatimonadota bacterium]
MSRGPFSFGTVILAGGASVLGLFLLVGYLLPHDWQAEATTRMPVTPAAVYALLDSPEGWQGWTPWPESGVERSGPARGVGATLAWNDLEFGSGSFRIVGATSSRVEYSVLVQEGTMRTSGSLDLALEEGGVRVTWREEGDFGRNPLMGYWVLAMSRAQSEELAKGLDRLRALAQERAAAAEPADSLAAVGGAPSAPNP